MSVQLDETWTYLGVRVNAKGQKRHMWLYPADGEMLFARLAATVVGGQYTVKATRSDTGEFESVTVDLKYRGRDDDARLAGWQAEDHLAKIALSRTRLARTDAKRDSIAEACMPLIEIRRASCRTHADRRAFAAMVLDYLTQLD